MAWKGGFSGVGHTRADFKKWLSTQKKPAFAKFLAVHNTAAPYISPPVSASQRIKNLGNYYKNDKKWSSGPHFFVIVDKVYGGTPASETGTHSPGWNGISLGVECEGDYRSGKHSPKTGLGGMAWDTMAWTFAELLEWLGWEATNDRIKFHREDAKTTHDCPGNLVEKDWFVAKVRAAMGKTPEQNVNVATSPAASPSTPILRQGTKGDAVKLLQTKLNAHGSGLKVDGDFGPVTLSAAKQFQSRKGLTVDGIVGPKTWAELMKEPIKATNQDAVAPPKVPEPASPPIVSPSTPETNPAKAMRLLQAGLWPKHWAAGAVAQAQRESYPDLRPWAQGDWMLNGKPVPRDTKGAAPTAFGIWQLRNDRWDNYQFWAQAKGKPWDDFETQVLWCPHELKTSEKLAWGWLQKAETWEQACAAMVWYERPAGYIPNAARAATTWTQVFAVSEKCDGWDARLNFARALMK